MTIRQQPSFGERVLTLTLQKSRRQDRERMKIRQQPSFGERVLSLISPKSKTPGS